MCEDIREMHEMADLLLHPPAFGDPLQLYSTAASNSLEEEEFQSLMGRYDRMFREGQDVE
jgi:hypothetical protein